MKARLLRLRHELGPLGWMSIVLLGMALAFSQLVVKPLEERSQALKSAIAPAPAQRGAAADKVEAVYSFLHKEDEATDWLAKLHGIGAATGVQMRSAGYRTQHEGRVERYEITLPIAGSYSQVRDFLNRALAEIPALSLDQMSLKRESRTDAVVHAELRLTVHRVKS